MRNEGKSKGGYYRTPEAIMTALGKHYLKLVASIKETKLSFLDPCCGKGVALAEMVDALNFRMSGEMEAYRIPTVETYGIEPNQARARKAARNLTNVLTTSFFPAIISDGAINCAMVNPPYDLNDEARTESGSHERLEITFLKKVTKKLCANGVLIYIVPQHVLKQAAPILASYYTDYTFARFPDTQWDTREPEEKREEGSKAKMVGMYEMFKQVVLICKKNPFQQPPLERTIKMIEAWSEMGPDAPIFYLDRKIEGSSTYTVPISVYPLRNWMPRAFDPDKAAMAVSIHQKSGTGKPKAGVWSSQDYQEKHWPDPEKTTASYAVGTTLAPIKKAHRAILAVAGFVNGATLTGKDGQQLTIKGYSRKAPKHHKTEDEEAVTETITDRFESALWAIEPDTGKLYCVDTSNKPMVVPFNLEFERMTLKHFLDNFGQALTEEIARANPSLYIGEFQVPWARAALKQLYRKPLGRQRDFILAQVNYLMNGGKRAGEVAEMATGKTYLSLAIAFLADLWVSGMTEQFPIRHEGKGTKRRRVKPPHVFPVVSLVPEIVTYKWKREAEQTIPDIKVVIIQRVNTQARMKELQAFDPTYDATTHLSAVGCLDRVMKRIQFELGRWEKECKAARAQGISIPRKPAHWVIVNSSTAKMNMEWSPCFDLKVVRTTKDGRHVSMLTQEDEVTGNIQPYLVPSCPDCGKVAKNDDRIRSKMATNKDYAHKQKQKQQLLATKGRIDGMEDDLTETTDVFLNQKDFYRTGDARRKWFCTSCGAPLWFYRTAGMTEWQPSSPLNLYDKHTPTRPLPIPSNLKHLPDTVKNVAERRISIADIIRKRYRNVFNLMIADEVHQGADGTAIGLARESIMQACDKSLVLTGTLMNGKASSLHAILRMINPMVIREYEYHGTTKWVKKNGVMQRKRKHYKERDVVSKAGAVTKREARSGPLIENEIAGYSPAGLRYVLSCCGFLELNDVCANLPPHHEYIHVVPMEGTLGKVYSAFESETTAAMRSELVKGNKKVLSPWFQGLLAYANMPYLGWVSKVKKTGLVLGEGPALPENMIMPKERALIDIVQDNVKRERRVLVYCEHTGQFDIMERMQRILQREVKFHRPLNVVVMHSEHPKPIDREAWLQKQVDGRQADGKNPAVPPVDVLICNPACVQVGLDLIGFPTIVYEEITTSTPKLRQSMRRHRRPGQTKSTETHILAYPGMETRMVALMAVKSQVSMAVEGQLGEGGLVSFSDPEAEDDDEGESMALALANQVMKAMDDGSYEEENKSFANNIQAMFQETAELEQELQKTIAATVDGSFVEDSADKYIEEEEEPKPAKTLPVELEPISMKMIEVPVHSVESGIIEEPMTEPIVIIPLARTMDPWALLRAKYVKPKKGSKKVVVAPAGAATLWNAEVKQEVKPAKKDKKVEKIPEVAPATLW